MSVIDADTHVDESESTWASLEGTAYSKYIPVTVTISDEEAARAGFNSTTRRSWVVEGRLQNRAVRDEINHPPRVRRELDDVEGRLAQMDEMGVDIQVIFPTFFIRHNTQNAEAEWALATTYNRWLAGKCEPTNGRLQWAAVLPWLNQDAAVEEVRWAKEHGACGIFKRGFDIDRKVTDPHFFPVYEEASRLDMPICIHTGHPLPSREWDRGLSHHVRLRRVGDLQGAGDVPQRAVRIHRVRGILDSLCDVATWSDEACRVARQTGHGPHTCSTWTPRSSARTGPSSPSTPLTT